MSSVLFEGEYSRISLRGRILFGKLDDQGQFGVTEAYSGDIVSEASEADAVPFGDHVIAGIGSTLVEFEVSGDTVRIVRITSVQGHAQLMAPIVDLAVVGDLLVVATNGDHPYRDGIALLPIEDIRSPERVWLSSAEMTGALFQIGHSMYAACTCGEIHQLELVPSDPVMSSTHVVYSLVGDVVAIDDKLSTPFVVGGQGGVSLVSRQAEVTTFRSVVSRAQLDFRDIWKVVRFGDYVVVALRGHASRKADELWMFGTEGRSDAGPTGRAYIHGITSVVVVSHSLLIATNESTARPAGISVFTIEEGGALRLLWNKEMTVEGFQFQGIDWYGSSHAVFASDGRLFVGNVDGSICLFDVSPSELTQVDWIRWRGTHRAYHSY